jgi:hypothetical protein
MKKIIYAVIAAVFIFVSCGDTFFSEPVIPQSNANRVGIPENVSASHGGKRGITLSWNQMPNAVLYYIYKAASPLEVFVRCGETTSNQYTFTGVQPGSTFYYRVSSVSHDGKESSQSFYVRGTSLAQPMITDIADITESSSTVTWYMDNVSEDTYKNNLLYTIYCFNGAVEVAQLALDGALISENKAVFTSLSSNYRYEYQVEAYLRSDQSASEKSERMDAATARRFRPGPPEKLKAECGTAIDKIILSFDLPDMVDIALGDNLWDPKPLYFVISKRRYNVNNSNDYQIVCSYFGTDSSKGANIFNAYIPGGTVRWADTNVIRGVEYEYMIQSYVDGTPRLISSDTSKASTRGWALSEGNLSLMEVEYELEPGHNLFGAATLPLDFDFDPKGISYSYTLVETIEPLGDDDPLDPAVKISKKLFFDTHDAICAYIPAMDLTRQTTTDNSGRGVYSYAVEIRLGGSAPESAYLDIIEAIGQVEVSENTQPLVVQQFRIQDGFTDKFILRWHYWSNRKYVIYKSDTRNGTLEEIATINANPTDDDSATDNANYEWTYSGQTTGITRYFVIQPFRALGGNEFKQGQKVYATVASRTLGVPKISQGGDGYSYSTITALWTEAQKADTYRIKYWYTEGGNYQSATVAKTVNVNDLSLDALGNYRFTFSPFENNTVDVSKAGKEIQIAVDALNEGLHATVGGGEISTTSTEEVKLHLVGPASIGLSASKAASTTDITVKWNRIIGADGYYVVRRQFNMTNTVQEGNESIVYYVPAGQSSSINVTGKSLLVDASTNARTDTPMVKATASFEGSVYQLQDKDLPDSEYSGIYNRHTEAYRYQQNDIALGYPYRYYVVPVVNRGGVPEPLDNIVFAYGMGAGNKNTNITSYTIKENNVDVRYSGAASVEQEGFVIGFGQNVVASKGTYASGGNVNDGIEITWDPPPRLSTVAGFNPRYTLHRRETGGTWTETTSNIGERRYVDSMPNRGVAYEYVVGISNGGTGTASQPKSTQRFIDLCYTLLDKKDRPNMLGFMLKMVEVNGVSRGESADLNAQFAEEVRWPAAGITNSASGDPNWGLDGYEVYVMNRNIDANWHLIADISNIPNQTNQTARVTNSGGLLKVMRDYKHFFKVRSYVFKEEGSSEKIYCPDPQWTYEHKWGTSQADHISKSEQMQNAYVKWGARQITRDEFIKISLLYVARGLQRVNSNAWNTGYFGKSENASTSYGGSGSIKADSNFGVTSWDFNFINYKDDLQDRLGQYKTFITINGKVWAGTGATNQYPQRYGDLGWVDVIGPWDTPGLYTGKFRIGGNGDDIYWDDANGRIYIQYPSANMVDRWKTEATPCERVPWRGTNTPLPYRNQANERFQQDAWR